ncbi:PH domain-containing protein [Arthrobacter caoxuetaonis]|uniref:PH domain-containing protein n=1 Tax=Arthrobacter caoxuetaonis TaxID=2886935 RepID=UPI001D14AD6B|nr:PH domain-containing protein [Arthrobacter caoxuetaonis]MCC3282422.1 PH domain-containing protein [Arthrobacter caoxuetaonis]
MRLEPGEQVIVSARPHAGPLVKQVLLAVLACAAGGFALGFLGRDTVPAALADWTPVLAPAVAVLVVLVLVRFCLPAVLRWNAARYVLTNRRLIQRRGVLRRQEHDLPLASVYQLEARQGILQRMQRSGTLRIDLGRGRVIDYPAVPEVHRFKSIVLATIEDLPMTVMFDGVDIEGSTGYDEWSGNE